VRSDTSTEDSSIEAAPIDRALAWCTIAASLVVRILYVYRYRFDSDEPQLLHVVWGWVNGLLPYRDVFDNHTPLFSLLSAPVLWAAGERPGALFVMRLAMIPLYLISLAAVYRIGSFSLP
jgi:hypothetical protein